MIPHGIERLAVPPHRIGQRLAGFVGLAENGGPDGLASSLGRKTRKPRI
jgi:hypothetical protein